MKSPNEVTGFKLNLFKRLRLKLFGYVFLYNENRPEWKESQPIYLVKCDKHDYFLDYPGGYAGKFYSCPECRTEKTQDYVMNSRTTVTAEASTASLKAKN